MATTDFRDGVSFTGAANNATVGPFQLLGGRYGLLVSSTGTPSATLQGQSPDGTYVAVGAAVTAYTVFDLPPGTYQIVGGAAFGTGAGSLVRVPYRPA